MSVRFVLVETSHPGNIGAAARAMRVMGFGELVLVRPRSFPHAEATAMASTADDVLERARVCDGLDDALAGARLVLATSARRRSLGWPEYDARAAAALAAGHDEPVALVFGRERSGLRNDELDRCHYLVHIPTATDYGSINLAQAVQVVAYELRMAALQGRGARGSDEPAAAHEDLQRFYEHLETALTDIGFLDPAKPRLLMRRLRRLFGRAEPSAPEVGMLRGILRAAQAPAAGTRAASRVRQGSRAAPDGGTMPERNDREYGDD